MELFLKIFFPLDMKIRSCFPPRVGKMNITALQPQFVPRSWGKIIKPWTVINIPLRGIEWSWIKCGHSVPGCRPPSRIDDSALVATPLTDHSLRSRSQSASRVFAGVPSFFTDLIFPEVRPRVVSSPPPLRSRD